MAVETPVEVGFAEFIARLMSEVFDSIITTQVDQEERYAAMHAAASLSLDEFRRINISADDVTAALVSLFPPRPEDKENPHMIWAGSPYTPAKGEVTEEPPVFAQTGVQLDKKDLPEIDGRPTLTKAAVVKISEAVAMVLASEQLAIAKQLLSRGLPRVVVDSGRINGKLSFNLTSTTQTNNTETTTATATPLASSLSLATKSVFSLPKARIIPDVKVMVKQADPASPQSSQVKADVYGEVEITFKTVT